MITRPMLAAELGFFGPKFPVLATPKIDGFRFLKVGGKALTRSMTPVRNQHVRRWIENNLPDGVDGEITVDRTFSAAQRALGQEGGFPDFHLWIFDWVMDGNLAELYHARADRMRLAKNNLLRPGRGGVITVLDPVRIENEELLESYEAHCLAIGYEGVMLRDPNGPYKCGRSTEAEGYLLKMKRFIDAESVIVGTFESVNRGQLGGFELADGRHDSFRVKARGIADLAQAWVDRESYIGRRIKYRFQPVGTTNAPRFPIMVGIRESWDLD